MAVPVLTLLLIFSAVISFGQSFTVDQRRLSARLERLAAGDPDTEAEIMRLPLSDRVLKPLLEGLGQRVMGLTPQHLKTVLDRRLMLAGPPLRHNQVRFLSIFALFSISLPLLAAALAWQQQMSWWRSVLAVLLAFVAGTALPVLYLDWRIGQRQTAALRSLPGVLDLLVVSVEAGLGFDMALQRVTEQIKGPLADELKLALNEIRLGRTRRTALRDLTTRLDVPDLNTFISSVIQADQLGVSIGNVLRVQTDSLRIKQRQRFQEQAMKASIKMLFPTVFLILPSLFIVILGPALLTIMAAF